MRRSRTSCRLLAPNRHGSGKAARANDPIDGRLFLSLVAIMLLLVFSISANLLCGPLRFFVHQELWNPRHLHASNGLAAGWKTLPPSIRLLARQVRVFTSPLLPGGVAELAGQRCCPASRSSDGNPPGRPRSSSLDQLGSGGVGAFCVATPPPMVSSAVFDIAGEGDQRGADSGDDDADQDRVLQRRLRPCWHARSGRETGGCSSP